MKILMRDHALYIGKIRIRGSLRIRKHKLSIKDIEALVLHRPHIEVAHGHNHEAL